jgi:hypothetical protein
LEIFERGMIMEFTSSNSSDCCTPTKGWELCGCVNGVAYVQLVVVGPTGTTVNWINTETGDVVATKPAGFVTGTCQDAALNDTFKISNTPPTATSPFAVPKDGDTVVYSDDLSPDNVLAYYRYEADTATWVEIPIVPAGGTEGFVLTKQADGSNIWEAPATQAILDNQVLTGGTGTNTTVTMTPVTSTDESGGTQVDYTVTASVKIDGTTLVEDPTTKVLSVVFPAAFKELNRFYVDPNGNDANTGANEAPKLTVQAAIAALGQGDIAIVNEGVYTGAVTMNLQNTSMSGADGTVNSLTQIASLAVTTPSGTSNRVSDLTVLGAVTHSGGAPLYLHSVTVGGNYTSTSTAYEEINDCRIQDGTITKTTTGTLYIKDSLIGNATFNTPNQVISLDNVAIDAGDILTIGAGVIYMLNDVRGHVVIDPAAIPLNTAALGGGLTGLAAKSTETAAFNDVRLTNVPTITTATKVLVRDADGVVSEQLIASAPIHASLSVLATAAQVTQTLPSVPVGSVIVTRNGQDISDSWAWSGAVGTYDQLLNYDSTIDENDKLKFHWEPV